MSTSDAQLPSSSSCVDEAPAPDSSGSVAGPSSSQDTPPKRSRSTKCKPCSISKKKHIKCAVDPDDPTGPCLDCKRRNRIEDCDAHKLTKRRRLCESTNDDSEYKRNYAKITERFENLEALLSLVLTFVNGSQSHPQTVARGNTSDGYIGQSPDQFGSWVPWASSTELTQPPAAEYSLPDFANPPPPSFANDTQITNNYIQWGQYPCQPSIPADNEAPLASAQRTSFGRRPDLATIKEYIAEYVSRKPHVAGPIEQYLDSLFSSKSVLITGFRAGLIYAGQGNHRRVPVVQWQEGHETEVMALFVIDDRKLFNVLLHYGEGIGFQEDGKRWRRSSIEWNVLSFENLKSLLIIAKQALGMHLWPEEELREKLGASENYENREEECCCCGCLSDIRLMVRRAKSVISSLVLRRRLSDTGSLFENEDQTLKELNSSQSNPSNPIFTDSS